MAKYEKGQSGNLAGRPSKKNLNSDPQITFLSLNSVRQEPVVSQVIRKQREYVFFGLDNLFPQRLVHFYDNISVHRKLINKIIKYIAGEGFIYSTPAVEKAVKDLSGGKPKKWLRKMANDSYMFNGFYWNVMYQNDGKIESLPTVDFTYMRAGKPEDGNSKPSEYWFSSDWKIATTSKTPTGDRAFAKPRAIPAFNPKTFKDKDSIEHGQIKLIETSLGVNGKRFYTEPTYMAILNWLNIAAKIADLHSNNLDNGMVGGMHIHLFEDLSDPAKRKKVENSLNEKYAGTNNASKIIVTWSVGDKAAPTLNQLPSNNTTEMAIALKNMANGEIIGAHDVPLIIAGEDVNTGISGKALGIRESLELFQADVRPFQDMITESINKVLELNGVDGSVSIKPLNPFRFNGIDDKILLAVLGRIKYAEIVLGMEDTTGIEDGVPTIKEEKE